MSNYPNSAPTFVIPLTGQMLDNPDHITQHLQEDGEISAIIAELGFLPKGTDASVLARLVRIDALAQAAVPQSTTVNGHALSGNVTITAGDLSVIPLSYLDTDTTLSTDSNSKVATQKAVKAYADTKQPSLGFTAENVANKSTDGTLAANSTTMYPTQSAVKTYADTKQPAGSYEVTSNKSTTTTLGTSDTLYPTQNAVKTYVDTGLSGKQASGSYEVTTNKSTTTTLGTSDTLYPTQNAVKTYVDTGLSGKQATLSSYDSGWFAVASGAAAVTKTHSLGTTKLLLTGYFSPNSNGSGCWETYLHSVGANEAERGLSTLVTTTTFVVYQNTNGGWPVSVLWTAGGVVSYTSGYLRIVALALP